MGRRQKNQKWAKEVQDIHPKTQAQQELLDNIRSLPISFGYGSAGTGKTLIALYEGVRMLEKGKVDKIIYLKPNVKVDYEEDIGFLKGTLEEKTMPLTHPILDNLAVFLTDGKLNSLLDQSKIEFFLVKYLRGRSIRNTYIILDEVQNLGVKGLHTTISRLEDNSKLVVIGDLKQRDAKSKGKENSLQFSIRSLQDLEGIVGFTEFTKADIVRNSYLSPVLSKFEEWEENR